MIRKILVLTGTRADYGRLTTVMDAINEDKGLELQLVVTGMHLLSEFGSSIKEIEKDGYDISSQFDMFEFSSDKKGMVKGLGIGITRFADIVEKLSPDIILVLGDRAETLIGAIVGSHVDIPVAHMHGGEITGSIDESIRHAATKFSHIHFPATEESAERLRKLGEKPEHIFVVGSPGLDTILSMPFMNPEEIEYQIGVRPDKNTILLAQHPVTNEYEDAGNQMRNTLNAVLRTQKKTIIIYPNADAGGANMIKEIERLKGNPNIFAFENLPYKVYLSLLKYVGVMVGNSSSGIMEAPSFGLPAVNIGSRQQGRERGLNIIDSSYEEQDIFHSIMTALEDTNFKAECARLENPYGDGKTGVRTAEILAQIELSKELTTKKITY